MHTNTVSEVVWCHVLLLLTRRGIIVGEGNRGVAGHVRFVRCFDNHVSAKRKHKHTKGKQLDIAGLHVSWIWMTRLMLAAGGWRKV